jgi:hypothetical protein
MIENIRFTGRRADVVILATAAAVLALLAVAFTVYIPM